MMSRDPAPETAREAAEPRAPRAPQQERGARRVEQILDAAEGVFAQEGVDAATMQMIADRAESSVGSLYHFFPNKEAIVEALGRRYADSMRHTNEEAMPLAMARIPAEELFERILSAQMAFIARTPAFTAVHASVHRHCPAISDALNQALVGHVATFMSLRYPRMPEPMRAASAMMSVAVVHGVIDLASRIEDPFRSEALKEIRAMLARHYGAHDAAYG